ncbi:DUF2680 domain-containing protein [Bacillus kwashiorkori]|uniref:DUF2680 domain-containing protein n=1 Tax=Bacillus kwashiorkori TaxID=1522318 RepID=UPI000783F56E|nr:DUF2680 domain-containing protein [Bacillus kwashiorkori]
MQVKQTVFMLLTVALFFLMMNHPMFHSFSYAKTNPIQPTDSKNENVEWKTLEREEQLGDHVIIGKNDGEQNLPNLTDSQREELQQLHKNLLDSKLQLIKKYEEVGLISAEKAKKIQQKMEKNYHLLEKNQFIPKRHENKRCQCKEREDGN